MILGFNAGFLISRSAKGIHTSMGSVVSMERSGDNDVRGRKKRKKVVEEGNRGSRSKRERERRDQRRGETAFGTTQGHSLFWPRISSLVEDLTIDQDASH